MCARVLLCALSLSLFLCVLVLGYLGDYLFRRGRFFPSTLFGTACGVFVWRAQEQNSKIFLTSPPKSFMSPLNWKCRSLGIIMFFFGGEGGVFGSANIVGRFSSTHLQAETHLHHDKNWLGNKKKNGSRKTEWECHRERERESMSICKGLFLQYSLIKVYFFFACQCLSALHPFDVFK